MIERGDTASVHRKQRRAKPDTLNGQEGPQLLAAGSEIPVCLASACLCVCVYVYVGMCKFAGACEHT